MATTLKFNGSPPPNLGTPQQTFQSAPPGVTIKIAEGEEFEVPGGFEYLSADSRFEDITPP